MFVHDAIAKNPITHGRWGVLLVLIQVNEMETLNETLAHTKLEMVVDPPPIIFLQCTLTTGTVQ